jgi:hypothetical protein
VSGATTLYAGGWPILVDHQDAARLGDYLLIFRRSGDYAFVEARHRGTGTRTRLSRLLMRPPQGMMVDHVNGNPSDNRRQNLRIVEPLANSRNRAKGVGTTSLYKGVSRAGDRWRAAITAGGGKISLGYFASEEAAARRYDAASRALHGAAGAVNFALEGEQCALRPRALTYRGCKRRGSGASKRGLKGVYPIGSRFRVKIKVAGKSVWVGSYATAEEAARAFDAAAEHHFGQFAWLNREHFMLPLDPVASGACDRSSHGALDTPGRQHDHG